MSPHRAGVPVRVIARPTEPAGPLHSHTSVVINRAALVLFLGVALVTACGQDNVGRAVRPASSPSVQASPACTTYGDRPSSVILRGPRPAGLLVPFTAVPGPFVQGGSQWSLARVDQDHPVTVGVVLGRDRGMRVDRVEFVVKPYAYRGGDDGLGGAVFTSIHSDMPADGQTLRATFAGLDNSGAPLPRGVYKVMVSLIGHRTSMSTCIEQGPVEAGFRIHPETGIIYGLASIGGASETRNCVNSEMGRSRVQEAVLFAALAAPLPSR
jgi:hypothetical protein